MVNMDLPTGVDANETLIMQTLTTEIMKHKLAEYLLVIKKQ